MNDTTKPFLLFQGPVKSRSGYGDHTRDLLKSLISMDIFDIKIAATIWGTCPETELNENTPINNQLKSMILTTNQLPKQPDVYVNCSIPNEWQPVGKFNIGITAGIETTIADPSWIEGCNRMDLVIVPSHHAKNVFLSSKYDQINNKTNQKTGELKIQKPIEVLFEGADTNIFRQLSKPQETVDHELKNISESFCFLYVGHWLDGKLGHDRKDTGMLVKTFLQSFQNKKNAPALILKTSSATFSIIDRNIILKKVNDIKKGMSGKLPNVYVLHGDLTPEEMNGLYNHPKVKAHISFTKGEGFGRPLLEASISGKPVIASGWSGHIDFLDRDNSVMLPGQLKEVHKSARWKGVINEGSSWFYVDYPNAQRIIRDVYKSYKNYLPGARKQAYKSRTNFSLEKMTEVFTSIVKKYVNTSPAPQQVQLNLPKLKKTSAEAPKINLPKLKRV